MGSALLILIILIVAICVLSIKYRSSDILLKKKHKLHLSCLFWCNHVCYCVDMVFVTSASRYMTSASRYHPRYQSRSSMYIHGLIPRKFAELDEAVPIECRGNTYIRNVIFHVKINRK